MNKAINKIKYLIVLLCGVLMVCMVLLAILMDNNRVGSSHKPTSNQVKNTAFSFDPETLTYDGNGKLDLMTGVTFNGQDVHEIADQLTINVSTGDSLTDKIITYKTETDLGTDIATRPLTLSNYHDPSITLPELPNVTNETKNNILEQLQYMEGFSSDDGFGNDATSKITVSFEKDNLDSSLIKYTFTFVNDCGDSAIANGTAFLEGADARIVLTDSSVTLKKGEVFNPMDYLESCTNAWYEDVSSQLNVEGDVDTSENGTYTVTYSIYDVEMKLTVKVKD